MIQPDVDEPYSSNTPGSATDRARKQRSLLQACRCAEIAADYRGGDTVVLDLTGVTPIVDYFVISTGTSRRQMHAIAEEVDRVLASEGSQRIGIEGYQAGSWILQDYGDIVLHVFSPETRTVYDLERLWCDTERINWRAASDREEGETG